MARSAASYAIELTQLLPPGIAWPRDPNSELGQLLLAWAQEFARLDQRCDDLMNEIDPRTTEEMLPDWERFTGLPDPAIPAPTTIEGRQIALCARLLSRGDPRPATFIAMAETFGYAATITLHVPFAADVSSAEDLLYDDLSRFWWEMNVTAPIGTATPIVALEHEVRRAIPAHTYVTFNYTLV